MFPEVTTYSDWRAAAVRHLCGDIVAWWLDNAVDYERGGVFTCWDNRGETLLSHDKYTWSQGRWVWLMAKLANAAKSQLLPLDAESCLALARETAVFLRDHAKLPDGTFAFVTDCTGAPKLPSGSSSLHTSVFADLFVALGFAALARQTGEEEWAEQAELILERAHAKIVAGAAATEPYPIPLGFAAFSLPMILVGVGAEVHAATGFRKSAEIVRTACTTIDLRFRQGNDIFEMSPDRAEVRDSLLARHLTPGHILEACWFLRRAGSLLGQPQDVAIFESKVLCDVALRACEIGWDQRSDGLFRYVDVAGGKPKGRRLGSRYETMVVDTWSTKLWWVHAEALYATLLLGMEGRPDLISWHKRIRDYTLGTFPAGSRGEWIQIRDRAGVPVDTVIALPVKDPFHIARSLLLIVELLSAAGEDAGYQWKGLQ